MRPTAAGIYPTYVQPNAPYPGEQAATSAYAQTQQGGNLVATVTRTKDDTVSKKSISSSANINKATEFSANLAETQSAATYSPPSSARFLKPDSLLSKLEKAKVDHLRTREDAIKKETEELSKEDAAGLSFVYETGPDGRNYIIGVATPLVLQSALKGEIPALSEQAQERAYAAYGQVGAYNPRAGYIDQAY